jgi:hypothetical protein
LVSFAPYQYDFLANTPAAQHHCRPATAGFTTHMQVIASHAATLTLSAHSQQYTAVPGSTSNICIPTTGQLQLTTSSCFVFGPDRGTYTIDVDPDKPLAPLVLQAEAAVASGEVVVAAGSIGSSADTSADSADSSSEASHPQEISITVTAPGQTNDAVQAVKAVAVDPARPGVYTYSITVDLGAAVELTPSVGQSSTLLLHPRSLVYKHDAASMECPPAVAAFEAKPGRMLVGVVEPAVEGAMHNILFPSCFATAAALARVQPSVCTA